MPKKTMHTLGKPADDYGRRKELIVSRIIKDFYLSENDLTKRPKIFGMTASPVDARVDVVQAAKSAAFRYLSLSKITFNNSCTGNWKHCCIAK